MQKFSTQFYEVSFHNHSDIFHSFPDRFHIRKRHSSNTYKLPTTAIEWNTYQGSTWVRKDKKPPLQLQEFTRELETAKSSQIMFFTNQFGVCQPKESGPTVLPHPTAKDHTDKAKELQNPFKKINLCNRSQFITVMIKYFFPCYFPDMLVTQVISQKSGLTVVST